MKKYVFLKNELQYKKGDKIEVSEPNKYLLELEKKGIVQEVGKEKSKKITEPISKEKTIKKPKTKEK